MLLNDDELREFNEGAEQRQAAFNAAMDESRAEVERTIRNIQRRSREHHRRRKAPGRFARLLCRVFGCKWDYVGSVWGAERTTVDRGVSVSITQNYSAKYCTRCLTYRVHNDAGHVPHDCYPREWVLGVLRWVVDREESK